MSSPWFDAYHPEVRRAQELFSDALARRGQFPAEEWVPALERSVRNVVSYHVRPARTLLEFLYAKETDVYTPAGLKRKTAFFSPYPYLPERLDELEDERQIDAINRVSAAELLREIDEHILSERDIEAWMRWLTPLSELVAAAGEDRGVPTELIVAFFRDKRAKHLEDAFERLLEDEGISFIEGEELASLIHREMEPERDEDEESPAVSVLSEENAVEPPPAPEPAPARDEGPVPLWKQFQHYPSTGRSSPAPAERPDPKPVEAPSPDARPLWTRFARGRSRTGGEATSHEKPGNLRDLEEAVLGEGGWEKRSYYIRTLFGGSQADYQAVLEKLSRARSWSEASRIIAEEVFRRNRVNIYSDPAVSFTDAVEARFESN